MRQITLAAAVLFGACIIATNSIASTWKVEFEINSEIDLNPIAGFFTFDSIDDGIRGANEVALTSDKFGEIGDGYTFENYWGGGLNSFEFNDGVVVGLRVGATRRIDGGLYGLAIRSGTLLERILFFETPTYDFVCNGIPTGCGDPNEGFGFVQGLELDLSRPEVVPVPASLPLLLVGLGGLGFIGQRRRKATAS